MANDLVPFNEFFAEEKQNVWTSLDLGTEDGKMLMIKAFGTADYSSDDLKTVPFEMQNVVVHNVRVISEDGEVIEAPRTVLISPDGQTVSFTSQGIMNSLRAIFSIFGTPPFSPPLKVMVKDVKTRKGWKSLNLVIVK